MRSTNITDRGIEEIKDMTTLRILYISETRTTKASFDKLRGIKGLTVNSVPIDKLH